MESFTFDDFNYHSVTAEETEHLKGEAFKIIFLGDIAVGKTNIMSRFTTNTFSINSKATIGVDMSVKPVKVGPYFFRLQLWDTSGQERYRTYMKAYFRDSSGIILVYDITNKESFQHVTSWLELGKKFTDDKETGIILVGNKRDLADKRQVSLEEGKDFANTHNIPFFEISALDNENECVPFAMLELIKSKIKRHCSTQNRKRPHVRADANFGRAK